MTYKYRERNKLFLYTLSEEFYKYELAQVLVYHNTEHYLKQKGTCHRYHRPEIFLFYREKNTCNHKDNN